TTLREFANLGDEAVIIGMYNYAEIWNVEAWNPVRQDIENNDDFERWQDLGI
ncbi:MAG: division/cell wall cluster transcriptional repressor MraZ, partial [Candidatus Promineifilaceae bacterium]